jgi:hypothetical protein
MIKFNLLLLGLFFIKLASSQLVSSYSMKLIAETENSDFKSQFNTNSDKLFYVLNSWEKAGLIVYDLINDTSSCSVSQNNTIIDFEVHPITKRFLIISNETNYSMIDSIGNDLIESKLKKRNIMLLEPAFNSNGNLLAFLGKVNRQDNFSLMTYDLKYDNLNQHFDPSDKVHEPDWSPKSDYLSYHKESPLNNTSLIEIVGWDGKPAFQIQSDTVKLSYANWGASSTKFICIASNDYFYYIFVMRTNGNHSETILKSKYPLSYPDWSGDGKKISVTVNTMDGIKQLWVIDLEKNTD